MQRDCALDREGYRPNVGIILINKENKVFWGKRVREQSWQFPQGGIKPSESPETAMFRELFEEVGLLPEHVKILGRKQIWFLLQLVGRDNDVFLRATQQPEFDAWRWTDYWYPIDEVIEFKKIVYERALTELSRFIPNMESMGEYLGRILEERKTHHKSI